MMKLITLLFVGCFLATCQTAHNVVLTWTDTSNPTGTQYNVYKANAACAPSLTFAKINQAPISAFTFTDTPVPIGPVCYYVTATNGTVESLPSVQAGATVLPFAPATLTLKVN